MAEKAVNDDIDFYASDGKIVVTCSEHGVVYEGIDPRNPVGRKNLVSAQSKRHVNKEHSGQ